MAEQDFFSWAQDAASGLIKAGTSYAQTQQQQKYEIDKMRLQALGELGYYQEGQAGASKATVAAGISPTVLLLAGGVLLVMMMRG